MQDQPPTVRARELGLTLQRAIEAVGLKQNQLGKQLGWSPSRVNRVLSGKRCVSAEDISALLAVCQIIGPKRDELMELARSATQRGWWQEFGDRLPPELRTLSDYEDAAIAITNFETTVIPGLLQTDAYMTALTLANPVIPATEIWERIEARRTRQRVLDRFDPATFRFFIDEYALSRTGPGREVMSDQVHHLLRMAVRPHVEIRVVPDGEGFHAGQQSFKLMEFTELNPVVFIESMTSALFLERTDTIEGYRQVVTELSRIALDEGQTRAWLASLATALGEPREEHDAPAAGLGVEEEFPQ